MSYEIKFGYISGQNLVFAAYQPDGTGRGIERQPLPELRTGYYGATPLTELVAGDEIIGYALDNVTWESSRVQVLRSCDNVFWENHKVFYEGVWVIWPQDAASQSLALVTSVGDVVGAQEYTIDAEDYATIFTNIEQVITDQQATTQTIDETGLDASGNPRALALGEIGYVEDAMREI